MHEDGHPSLDQFMILITAGDTEAAYRLASECAGCAESVRRLRRLLETARADRMTAPPPTVLQRAVAIFARPTPAAAPARGLRRLIGALVFDSYRMPALSMARGSARLARQLRYQVEELGLEVDLQLERDPSRQDRFAITGQVLPDAKAPLFELTRITVYADSGGEVPCTLYETGEFFTESLAAEPHTLLVRTDSHEIALPVLGLQDG
jgi:hypothetical protein